MDNTRIAPIITVVHSDGSNLNVDEIGIANDSDEMRIANEKTTEDRSQENTTPIKEHVDENKNNEDDQDSVIIEEVVNKTIDVDEDSNEELELSLEHGIGGVGGNDSFTKATEFVIVNAANISAMEAGDDTESAKRYGIEDIQIKDELAESIAADLNTNDVLENDPMDLLELNTRSECTSSTRSQPDTEDYGDDGSSVGSSSAQTGSSSSTSVLDWIKDYPWLLYEEGDEIFGYCLYCDTKINIKSQRSVKQHGLSLYHKERCENYLAFREEEEKNGLSMKLVEIKEEFGTDSRVEALKLKRKSQSVALNNFNWRRWLEDYPWLERESTEGTIGHCKYCLMNFNVEFSYLRDRHQESAKHKEAEKAYEENHNTSNEKSKSSKINEDKAKESTVDSNQTKKWLELVENEPLMARCKICGTKMFRNNFLRHLRTNLHEHNEQIYLLKSVNEQTVEEEPSKIQHNWNIYAKQHPWLVADPSDPSFGYCKYCDKRIVYGASAAKRATHENSSQHKHNESELKKRSRKVNSDKENYENADENEGSKESEENLVERNNDDDEEDEDGEDEDQNEENDVDNDEEEEDEDETNEDENEEAEDNAEEEEEDENQQEKDSEDENDSKKRVYRLTEEWINQYSWCKRYNKDPKNFIFCIYCKIPLSVTYSRSKHQNTSYHIASEKEFLDRQAKKLKLQEKKQINETSPFYEWAIPLRKNPNSYSCRYCRVRISKNYSKKQHASSKIHQINEGIYKNNRRKSVRRDDNNSDTNNSQQAEKVVTQLANVASPKKVQTFAKVVIKAPSIVTLIKKWQKKFPWLSYKRSELRSNYGHCKLCDSSLYIRSLKHVLRHVRSPRHIRTTKANKKQKIEKDQGFDKDADKDDMPTKIVKKGPKEEFQISTKSNDSASQNHTNQVSTTPVAQNIETSKSPKTFNYKSTIEEMKKRFSWIEKSEIANYVFCRFCNTSIPLKVLFLRNHSNSHKHRYCVINYRPVDGKKVFRETRGQTNADSEDTGHISKRVESSAVEDDDDVMIVEENSEEILISEQDENWTVKSETMDEHEELDYLLQRSFNSQNQNKSNVRNVRKSTNIEDDPPSKRIKRSHSFRRFNDSNSSLVASLLTTPLTLASCLGPLIQQQIQQQANISQTSQTNSNPPATAATGIQSNNGAAVESENTYDLFFKSISETIKRLPVDLAAEGKLRVMQIICDLELQALKRQQNAQSESLSSNTSGGLSYQPTSTSSAIHATCNSSVVHDVSVSAEVQNDNSHETIITQLNMNTDVTPQPPLSTTTQIIPTTSANSCGLQKSTTNNDTSPIIGVMDKNGLQTIHLKTPASKQMPRSIPTPTNTSTATTVANSGIRCIPFKNLSQTTTSDTPPNTKITRIQVPMNVTTQSSSQNTNPVSTSKNLINFRNIQITKRIATSPAASVTGPSTHQQTAPHTSGIMNKSPQRTYITSIQPQLQRWGCSVNGTPSHHTPTSSTVSNLKQLSSQQTSTPISKKN